MLIVWLAIRHRHAPRYVLALAVVVDLLLAIRSDWYRAVNLGGCAAYLLIPRKARSRMPSLAAIAAAETGGERELAVPYGASIVRVMFDPGKVTGEVVTRVQEEQTATAMADALALLITSWDLTLDEPKKGKPATPYPPTTENLLRLPIAFLTAIMTEVGKDLNPTGEAAGSFGAG